MVKSGVRIWVIREAPGGLVPSRLLKVGTRHAEERSRLVEGVTQAIEAAIERDQVEKITMFAGGGVSPFAGGALAAVRTVEPDEQAAPRRVGNVADQPIAALAMAVGEIVAAHRLGIARETVGQIGGV